MTDIIKLTGTIYWAKVYEPDSAFGAENYKFDFYPETEEDWKKFNDSGIQKKVKENEHGKFFQLVRPSFKLIKGTVVNFTGPVITDKDNKVIVDYVSKSTGNRVYSYDAKKKDDVQRRGSPILIGNGSKVEITVAVYDTFKGKGHRFETIKILDLIEYKREGGGVPELSPLVTNKELNKDLPVDLSKDEIPFGKSNKDEAPW